MKQIVKTLQPTNQIQIDSALSDYMKGESGRIICQVYKGNVSILTKYNEETFLSDKYAFYNGGDWYNCASVTASLALEKAVGSGVEVYFFDNWKEFAQAVIDNNWH